MDLINDSLKLFMKMNQNFFDECVKNFKAEQQQEKKKIQERADLWIKIEQRAKQNIKVGFKFFKKK